MPIRVKFDTRGENKDGTEWNMVAACNKIFEHYDLEEYPELFHRILEEVDGVRMKNEAMYKDLETGKPIALSNLSNTCKSLLCLCLDTEGLLRYRLSYIGWGYHYLLTEINDVCNAELVFDIELRYRVSVNPKEGAVPIGFWDKDYDRPFMSLDNYLDQCMNADLRYMLEANEEFFHYKNCSSDKELDEYKIKLYRWSEEYPWFPDDEPDDWIDYDTAVYVDKAKKIYKKYLETGVISC